MTEIHLPLSLRLEAGDFFRKYVKMYLDQNGVTYDERNVSKVEEYMEELSMLEFQSVPVTVGLGVGPFAGFELKKLDEIIQQKKSQ